MPRSLEKQLARIQELITRTDWYEDDNRLIPNDIAYVNACALVHEFTRWDPGIFPSVDERGGIHFEWDAGREWANKDSSPVWTCMLTCYNDGSFDYLSFNTNDPITSVEADFKLGEMDQLLGLLDYESQSGRA